MIEVRPMSRGQVALVALCILINGLDGFDVLSISFAAPGTRSIRHLIAQDRWQHSWGVGRNRDGSQIFDYWRDPFGNKIEHWTDGDLVNDAYVSSNSPFSP